MKSTIRTNTATSDDTISNFMSVGSKYSKFKNVFTEPSEGSVVGGSMFSSTMKNYQDTGNNQTPLKMPSLKHTYNSEKKSTITESRYLKLK